MLEGKKIFNVIGIFITTCILIIGISFAYGSITNKLPINGYASMNTAKWSVHFQNLSNANLKGNAIEINKPILQNNSTSISDFDVMFETVNDGVTYTFEVVNDGDLDAKVSSIVIPKPVCMEIGGKSSKDSDLICANLNYSLTYADGTSIKIGDSLDKGQSKSFILNLEYLGTQLPQNEIEISELSITLIYMQK